MHAGRRTQNHHRSKSFGTSHSNEVRAVILLDEQPVRRDLIAELRKIRKSLHRLRREIDHHEVSVRPSFHRWYHGRFSEKIAALDKLREEFEEKMTLLSRMRDLYSWRGLTRQKAFSQATKDFDAAKRAQKADEESSPDEHPEDEFEKDSCEFSIDEELSGSKRRLRSTSCGDDFGRVSREKEIKLFYRKLAQVLHPDRNAAQNKALRELWFETQCAYAEADLEHLKFIWTECIIEADPDSGEIRVRDLQEALGKIKAALSSAQRKKSELIKSDPTWNFEKKNKEKLVREILSEFFTAEMDLNGSIRGLDREIKIFSGNSGRHRRAIREAEEIDI